MRPVNIDFFLGEFPPWVKRLSTESLLLTVNKIPIRGRKFLAYLFLGYDTTLHRELLFTDTSNFSTCYYRLVKRVLSTILIEKCNYAAEGLM